MPDLPKTPAVNLNETLSRLMLASQAVKHGIATHAQKQADLKSEQHAKLESNRRLKENK